MKISLIVGIYLVILVIGATTAIIYHNSIIEQGFTTAEVVIGFNIEKKTNIEREKIFNVMSDLENYPQILKGSYVSVKILNKTFDGMSTIIFAEEQITQSGIITTLQTKHSILPNEIHKIEVLDGDAKWTTITSKFFDTENGTKIDTELILRLKGVLAPFGQLTQNNIQSALSTILDKFENYAMK